MRWRRSAVAIVLLCGLWGNRLAHTENMPVSRAASPPYGPLRLVNQQPTQLLFLQQFPDLARPVERGQVLAHVNVALTNTLVQEEGEVFPRLNLEMVRTVVDLRYGLYPGVEMGFEIPILYTYGGILDVFISGIESFFSDERIDRREEENGAFIYEVSRGDRPFIRGREDAVGLGEVILKAKIRLYREQRYLPAVSLRLAVKFPTGSTSRAFGSGKLDGGFGLLLQYTLGHWTFYINADMTIPGQAFNDVDLTLRPFFSGIAAAEWHLSHRVSLVLQFRGDTRPFQDTSEVLDKRIIESILGINWAFSRRLILQGGVAEDQFNSACCAADTSFFLNVTGRL